MKHDEIRSLIYDTLWSRGVRLSWNDADEVAARIISRTQEPDRIEVEGTVIDLTLGIYIELGGGG